MAKLQMLSTQQGPKHFCNGTKWTYYIVSDSSKPNFFEVEATCNSCLQSDSKFTLNLPEAPSIDEMIKLHRKHILR